MRKRVSGTEIPPERDLAAAWQRAGGVQRLHTRDGAPLDVRYPGRRNHGPGPDFLDAILDTADGEVRGAVEVHRRSSDWARHRHGADPRYAGVVLHVVGQDDGAAGGPPGGTQLPLLELGRSAAGWPCPPAPLVMPCAQRAGAGHDLLPAIVGAGAARFGATVDRLRRQLSTTAAPDGWEQVAYEWIAEALGFERNAAPMRDLAAVVPLDAVASLARWPAPRATLLAEALILGCAGLLPSQRHLPARRRRGPAVDALEGAWLELGRPDRLRAYRWDGGGVRPENAPLRRALALAHLALRWPLGGIVGAVRQALQPDDGRPGGPVSLSRLVRLPCPQGYWKTHWDFGVPGTVTGALIGDSRAADVTINVLLPLAAAVGAMAHDDRLAKSAGRAYGEHPALAENWITRLVRERAGQPALPRRAIVQQGLLGIYDGVCRELRCGDCAAGGSGAGPSAGRARQGSGQEGAGLAGEAFEDLQLRV